MLVDVSERDLGVTVLGRRRPHPVFVAPTAFHGLAHPGRRAGTARAAAAADALFCLSSLATAGPAEVAEAAPSGQRWLQLYVFRDRGRVKSSSSERPPSTGIEAIVVTVDLPVLGNRERDVRTQYAHPGRGHWLQASARRRRRFNMRDIGELIDPSLTWVDIEAARLQERATGAW